MFEDFECPACRSFALGALQDAKLKFGSRLRVAFRHWPLPYHRFALAAARAAECAGSQGAFWPMHDLLFEKQDSFGLKPWEEFGRDAKVSELSLFGDCIRANGNIPGLEVDSTLVARLNLRGTPSILLEGSVLGWIPESETLVDMVDSVLAAK